MKLKELLIPSLLGTSAMTLCSFLISEIQEENFLEPANLTRLLKRPPLNYDNEKALAAGWAAHYAAGVIFVLCYLLLWKKYNIKANISSGIALGAAAGLCGIAAWNLTLKMHPDPPQINKQKYFGHLFLAHIVFGIFATSGYRLARK